MCWQAREQIGSAALQVAVDVAESQEHYRTGHAVGGVVGVCDLVPGVARHINVARPCRVHDFKRNSALQPTAAPGSKSARTGGNRRGTPCHHPLPHGHLRRVQKQGVLALFAVDDSGEVSCVPSPKRTTRQLVEKGTLSRTLGAPEGNGEGLHAPPTLA